MELISLNLLTEGGNVHSAGSEVQYRFLKASHPQQVSSQQYGSSRNRAGSSDWSRWVFLQGLEDDGHLHRPDLHFQTSPLRQRNEVLSVFLPSS